MSAIAKFSNDESLLSEWKRIEILGQCLLDARDGRSPSDELLCQLSELQHQVDYFRKDTCVWAECNVGDLPSIALDVLACVYAPLINPNVSLQYQDLQQSNSIHPTLAFLNRLLAFNDQEYSYANNLVANQGVLVSRGLLLIEGDGPMMQLKPHTDIASKLLGIQKNEIKIPGAIEVDIKTNWDDLVVKSPQKRMIQEYLLWIKHKDKVVDDWGGKFVGGPIALFSGASGTGKTFAASVIANELSWKLYRVDLGALVSKYIGETEKNLNALFEAAQGQKVILQFDEADALMGKRGEISDARDRYANMEVSHLLSRIEKHDGPCILTTNLSNNIDHAFKRRLHFVIDFTLPDYEARCALWRCLIPQNAPLCESLELDLVAESVALTGGEIRNAALHAAILAASESTSIQLKHITIGIWRVLQKTEGKTRLNQLRQLEKYLPKEIHLGEVL